MVNQFSLSKRGIRVSRVKLLKRNGTSQGMRVFRVWVTEFHCNKLFLSFANGFLNVEFKVCIVNLLTWYACCSSSIPKQILTIISWYTIGLVRAWICSCKRKVKTIQKSLLHSGKRNDDYTIVDQTTLYCSNTQNGGTIILHRMTN